MSPCPGPPEDAVRPARSPLAVAHRGDPYRYRENTLASLRSAVERGADAVELDVRVTRDGVAVVHHDTTLERLWGAPRAVADLTAAEVRQLTGGGVPTLREALEVTAATRTLIDLPVAADAPAAVATAREVGAADRVYYCGGPAAMRAVRAREDRAEIALTWQRSAPLRPTLLADVRPRWLNYRFGLLTGDLVHHAHRAGYLVGVWTVDSPGWMRRLRALGVDAITSNRISALRGLLDRGAIGQGTSDPARRRPPTIGPDSPRPGLLGGSRGAEGRGWARQRPGARSRAGGPPPKRGPA